MCFSEAAWRGCANVPCGCDSYRKTEQQSGHSKPGERQGSHRRERGKTRKKRWARGARSTHGQRLRGSCSCGRVLYEGRRGAWSLPTNTRVVALQCNKRKEGPALGQDACATQASNLVLECRNDCHPTGVDVFSGRLIMPHFTCAIFPLLDACRPSTRLQDIDLLSKARKPRHVRSTHRT